MTPVNYKGIILDADLRLDVLVEDFIIVELKAMRKFYRFMKHSFLTYYEIVAKPKGILINFNCTNIFKEGQKRWLTNTMLKYLLRFSYSI